MSNKKIVVPSGSLIVPSNVLEVTDWEVPIECDVDAYQVGFQEAGFLSEGMINMQLYHGTHRTSLLPNDKRLLQAGVMGFVQCQLSKKWTHEGVDRMAYLMSDFHARMDGTTEEYPFPEKVMRRVVDEFNGTPPLLMVAMPDGMAHYAGEPNCQIGTDIDGMGEVAGWYESQLGYWQWPMTGVATRGRFIRQDLFELYKRCHPSMDEGLLNILSQVMFHDFGARGSVDNRKTGVAHLMNFLGTDTIAALYIAVDKLNGGKKFGACSIIAAAHKSITCHDEDKAAGRKREWNAYYQHIVGKGASLSDAKSNASRMLSLVSDTYGYENAVDHLCSSYREAFESLGGKLIVRPDSGDPVQCVLYALERAKATGWKHDVVDGLVLFNHFGVIQGDGIDRDVMFQILEAVIAAGFSPLNVAIGMGENNHKVVRSMTEWGYKLAQCGDGKGGTLDAMKKSSTEFKLSIPCAVKLNLSGNGSRIQPITAEQFFAGEVGDYRVIFDGRPGSKLSMEPWLFEETRDLAWNSWNALEPNPGDTIDPVIRQRQREFLAAL